MSVTEIKRRIEEMSSDERRELSAFLTLLDEKEKSAHRKALTARIDDKNADQWVTLEEFDQRLGI